MEVFGSFEATKVAREGNFGAVMFARRAGTNEERFAIKVFRPPEWMMEDGQIDRESQLFLESAESQRAGHVTIPGSWAPVYEMGRCEGGAWYATDLFECSLEWLRINSRELEIEHVRRVVETIVQGLLAIQKSQGRAHGNLKPTNVMIQGRADLARARIQLCDPKPTSRNKGQDDEQRDSRDLGDLIHQLVLHRPFQNVTEWPIQSSDKWQRLGKLGAGWLALMNRLLDPTTATKPSIADIAGELPGGKLGAPTAAAPAAPPRPPATPAPPPAPPFDARQLEQPAEAAVRKNLAVLARSMEPLLDGALRAAAEKATNAWMQEAAQASEAIAKNIDLQKRPDEVEGQVLKVLKSQAEVWMRRSLNEMSGPDAVATACKPAIDSFIGDVAKSLGAEFKRATPQQCIDAATRAAVRPSGDVIGKQREAWLVGAGRQFADAVALDAARHGRKYFQGRVDAAEAERKQAANVEKREREQREKEQREKDQRERESREKEQREKDQREKERRDKEQQEKDERERERREQEQRETEKKDKERREKAQREQDQRAQEAARALQAEKERKARQEEADRSAAAAKAASVASAVAATDSPAAPPASAAPASVELAAPIPTARAVSIPQPTAPKESRPAPEPPRPQARPQASSSSGGGKKIAIAAAAILAVGGTAAYFVMSGDKKPTNIEEPVVPPPPVPPLPELAKSASDEAQRRTSEIKEALAGGVRNWIKQHRTELVNNLESAAKTAAIELARQSAEAPAGQRESAADAVRDKAAAAAQPVAEAGFKSKAVPDAAAKQEITALPDQTNAIGTVIKGASLTASQEQATAEARKAVQAIADALWTEVLAAEVAKEAPIAAADVAKLAGQTARDSFLGTKPSVPTQAEVLAATKTAVQSLPIADTLTKALRARVPALTQPQRDGIQKDADDAAINATKSTSTLAEVPNLAGEPAGTAAVRSASTAIRQQWTEEQPAIRAAAIAAMLPQVETAMKAELANAPADAVKAAAQAELGLAVDALWNGVLDNAAAEAAKPFGESTKAAAIAAATSEFERTHPAPVPPAEVDSGPVREILTRVRTQLDGGVDWAQASAGLKKQLADARAANGAAFSLDDIKPLAAEIDGRLARLDQLEAESDPSKLPGYSVPDDAGKLGATELITVWNKLGSMASADLAKVAAARAASLAATQSLADAAVQTKVQSAVDAASRQLWMTAAASATTDPSIDLVKGLQGPLGVAPDQLDERVRFNFALRDFKRNAAQVQGAGEARATAIKPIALTFADAVKGMNVIAGEQTVQSALAAAQKVSEWTPGSGGGGGGPLGSGPATVGWTGQMVDGDTVVFSPPGGQFGGESLRFHRVNGAFLCETEFPMSLFVAAFKDKEMLDRIKGGYTDAKQDYFKVWEISGGGAPNVLSQFGISNSMIDTPAHQAAWWGMSRDQVPRPTPSWPLNAINAKAATVIASTLGCRLPSVDEWRAAAQLEQGAPRNLRDESWFRVWSSARQFNLSRNNLDFYPDRGALGAQGRTANTTEAAPGDGFAFFAPVSEAAFGGRWKHLYGNVAEWVVTGSSPAIPAGIDIAKVPDAGGYAAVGGSAISPPPRTAEDEVVTKTRLGQRITTQSFFDVGFRLAFSAGGGGGSPPPDAEIGQLVNATYLPGSPR